MHTYMYTIQIHTSTVAYTIQVQYNIQVPYTGTIDWEIFSVEKFHCCFLSTKIDLEILIIFIYF